MGCLILCFSALVLTSHFGSCKRGGRDVEIQNLCNRNQLDIVVKEIEFYKLCKGSYPELRKNLEAQKGQGLAHIYEQYL